MRAPLTVLAACLLTSACGFHPLYGGSGTPPGRLATIYVDIIPNRSGQLLRQAVQTRLEGARSGIAKQYTLAIAYSENVQGLGIQSDNSTTRNRNVGVAVWSLHPAGNSTVQIVGGTVRTLDGYNILDEQFFYADLSEEAAQRRLADNLADQIVTGLALYFDRQKQHS